MININVKFIAEEFDSLHIVGHSDDKLVCAGVSSIFVGGLNNLEVKKYEISINEGNSYLKVKEKISTHDKDVIETILIQLETISQSHKKDVKLIKEN